MQTEPFTRGLALSPHEHDLLDMLLRPFWQQFGHCYLVGSALRRRDPRDIDVRCMVDDDHPLATSTAQRRTLNDFISLALSAQIGLRVDFQFQGTTEGNEISTGPRSAIGMNAWRQ